MANEEVMCYLVGIVCLVIGVFIGAVTATGTSDVIELENKCIVYESKVYCEVN